MADFTLQVRGVVVVPWNDPQFDPTGPEGVRPSRVNPKPSFPLQRLLGTLGNAIIVEAIVGGVVAPLDAALGGRLFAAWFVQAPDAVLPATLLGAPVRSSVQTYVPTVAGHYAIGVRRHDGGIEHVHVDVQ